jgi:capsular polysaccharide transport system permease protein
MTQAATFRSALRTQGEVLGSLVLRETHVRFGATRLGYVWVLIEPMAHALGLSLLYYLMGRNSPVGGNVVLFFMTGLMPFFLWNKVSRRLLTSFTSDRPLLLMPIVTRLDILISRAMLEGTAWIVVSTILFTALVSYDMASPPHDLEALCAATAITFIFGFGVGTINATVTALLRSWHTIFLIITRPLYLASGVFYLVDQLPNAARNVLAWNPLVHCVEWFRSAFYPSYTTMTLDKDYLLKWAIATFVIGLALERMARRRVTST